MRISYYFDDLGERWKSDIIGVVVPEYLIHRWRQLLHN
jgi:hypothetical protein